VWTLATPDVQGFTRACVYDHAGVGYSGPAPRVHTSRQMAGELHSLLAAAGVSGPYVLVGNSFGGLNARTFVSEHPAEVAGLVLVDAATEWQDRVWGMLLPEQYRIWKDNLRDRPHGINFDAYRESVEQVRAVSRSLGAMPLVVLTHGVPFPREPGTPDDVAERMERELQAQQVWLATLSSNSVQVVSANSGHFIEVQNPKLVVAAVRETVDAVRTDGRVYRERLSPRWRTPQVSRQGQRAPWRAHHPRWGARAGTLRCVESRTVARLTPNDGGVQQGASDGLAHRLQGHAWVLDPASYDLFRQQRDMHEASASSR
jgi:pimeloyl-ACP methyl ester carboxylesterase